MPKRRSIPESLRYIAEKLRAKAETDQDTRLPAQLPDVNLLAYAASLDSFAEELEAIGPRLVPDQDAYRG